MAAKRPKSRAKARNAGALAQRNQRAKLVEEFARLDAELDAVYAKIQRHKKLRELILDWYPDLPAEDQAVAEGATCDIVISARDKIRSVTLEGKRKLFKLWGSRDFIARSAVFLKFLPDPEDPKGLFTVQALTGPRHLHVERRAGTAVKTA